MKIPVEEQYKFVKLTLPDGSKADGQEVLLKYTVGFMPLRSIHSTIADEQGAQQACSNNSWF